jgi:hypothetical protein
VKQEVCCILYHCQRFDKLSPSSSPPTRPTLEFDRQAFLHCSHADLRPFLEQFLDLQACRLDHCCPPLRAWSETTRRAKGQPRSVVSPQGLEVAVDLEEPALDVVHICCGMSSYRSRFIPFFRLSRSLKD